ncbi:JNK1/MAPK8-associated membrane protein-like [Bolinopsis microptera]|uniref:JNK1/MAPK8-associated membrane protein-like n=1 Tax=Bolinopsis microptera TaxID=2820187 RepID=UPI0030795DA6
MSALLPEMKCPGRYCGLYEGVCTACPRGMRVDVATEICQPCLNDPVTYEWLYLGFMVLVVVYFHMESLTRFLEKACGECDVKSTTKWIGVALLETILAAFLTLILSDPHGKLNLYGCGVTSFLDWYSVFQNPTGCIPHFL